MIDLRPVKPADAAGLTRTVFEEARDILAVPWVPPVFQAFAMYPEWLDLAWLAAAPRLRTAAFLDETEELESLSTLWTAWYRPPSQEEVRAERPRLRAVLSALAHGNAKLALLSSLYRLGLDGDLRRAMPLGEVLERRPVEELTSMTAIELVMPEEAGTRTRCLFRDIERSLGLPLVAVEYQALAWFPSALDQVWPDLRVALGSPEYRAAETKLGHRLDEAAQHVGLARRIDRGAIRQTTRLTPSEMANLAALVHMFRRVAPGLCLQVAMMRRVFAGG